MAYLTQEVTHFYYATVFEPIELVNESIEKSLCRPSWRKWFLRRVDIQDQAETLLS